VDPEHWGKDKGNATDRAGLEKYRVGREEDKEQGGKRKKHINERA